MNGKAFLDVAIARMGVIKDLGDGALAQSGAPSLFARADETQNSIAIIVQHLCGNMLSRWTDLLDTDGEKPGRRRDEEFEPVLRTQAEVHAAWHRGWECCLGALRALTSADVLKPVTIRGESMSAMDAIVRQVGHYAYHVGQMVLLAKQQAGADFKSLSIPRGQSRQYRPQMRKSGTRE